MKAAYTDDGTGRLLAQGAAASNDSRATGLNNNDMVIGPSGCGKTGGYVIPNILRAEGSIVVADTKRNLAHKLGDTLRGRGYDVYVIDFVKPERSVPYNPLEYILTDARSGQVREQDVMTIVRAIVSDLSYEEPFWELSARTVAACLISYVKEVFEPEEQTLGTVAEVYKVMCNQYAQQSKGNGALCLPFLEEWSLANPDGFAARKYHMFKGSLGADRTWSCIEQFVSSAFDVFDFREARRLFSASEGFRLEDLGRRKCAVFLNISDTDRSLDRLVNLFYTQTLHVLCREADKYPDSRLPVPVRLFLDDFATNAYIPDFDKMISVIRSREISVSVILQSLTQLETMYKKPSAATILGNCDHVLYMGGNDLDTAQYVSMCADTPLQKVLCMPLDKVYLMTRGQKAQLLDKIEPYSYALPAPELLSTAPTEPFAIQNW